MNWIYKNKNTKYLCNTINKLDLVNKHIFLQKFVFNGGFKHKQGTKIKNNLPCTKPQSKCQKCYPKIDIIEDIFTEVFARK